MRAGKLRHRVQVQSASETSTGSHNETARTYTTVATRWARVSPFNGDETEFGPRVHSKTLHEVEMRYFAGLTTEHRLLFGTRALNILRIKNTDERNIEQHVVCVEAD